VEHGANACKRACECKTLPMWEKVDKMLNDYFESITLDDLIRENGVSFDYTI
jgi:hypothetical protein